MNSLKISSFNTRGLLNTKKRISVFQYFRETKSDIILLQETHSKLNEEYLWRLNWEKQAEVIFNRSHSQGGELTILLKT